MTILIHADRLFDGTGRPAVPGATLVVEGGTISAVHPGEPPPAAPGTTVLDLRGCTLMPGLIDAHVHLNLPGNGATLEEVVREPDEVLAATAAFAAGRALRAGITTVRDLGAARGTVFAVRRALSLGHGRGARIIACGQPLTITGGHTWYLGGEADGEDTLRRRVREMVKQGADFIKVMASGGGTVGTASWLSAYRPAELAAIVDEAHRLERKVAMHCLCASSIDDAIAAGADHIEHAGFIVDAAGRQEYRPDVAERLARSGIPVSATLAVGGCAVAAMERLERRTPAEDAFLARWRTTLARNLDQFRRMREAGVAFVAGTDAGWRFTTIEALPTELSLMHEGGMGTLDVLAAATGRCAQALGVGGELGTLRPGLAADVIAVEGDPAVDLDCLHRVRFVMQNGVVQPAGG